MSFVDNLQLYKRCYVSCGDRCNCQPNTFTVIPYIKFEEKYLVLNMYSYLNHPQYNNFVQYLNSSNKIAVIFCKSDDEMFNIINSDLVLKYKVYSLADKYKILKELQADFDAIQVDYRVDDDYAHNSLVSYSIIENEEN